MDQRELTVLTLIISLMAHLLISMGFYMLPGPPARTQGPIEIEVVPHAKTQKTRNFVKEAQVPEELKSKQINPNEPVFLSKENQRVKKQQQASLSGETKNQALLATANSANEKPPEPGEGTRLKQVNPLTSPYEFRPLPSTIGQALPNEISIGSFTALNTDRFEYYSFFSRVEDMIRFNWEHSVLSTIRSMDLARARENAGRNWTSQLEILLDRQGNFKKAILLKSSGITGFDQAAESAFRQARLFPNPPQELVDSDGYIHLKYAFQVRYDERLY